MRTKAKRDANEPAIVKALEDCGVAVLRVSSPGAPDLLLYSANGRLDFNGGYHRYLPAEVKRTAGKLTPAQQRFRDRVPFPTLHSVNDALALVGVQT